MPEPDEYTQRARIELEKADLLEKTSPEFQAEVKKQREEEVRQRAAQLEEMRRQHDNKRRREKIESLAAWALMIGGLLGAIYGLVKFVKWAWYS